MKRLFVYSFVALIVSGCGGGGGSNKGSSDPQNIAPKASITASANSGVSPAKISFDASGSSDSDGSISNYKWNFGDGGTASGVSVTHTFDAGEDTNQQYTVTLTVTDNDGATASTTAQADILRNASPVVNFSYTQVNPSDRLVDFNTTGSFDPEGSELRYVWDFGDGTSANGKAPAHEYQANGQYHITLKVDDQTGRTASLGQTAVVSNGKFSIIGQVSAARGVTVDTDTNDPQSQHIPNNSLTQAQVIPSSVNVSGFVTYSATGLAGDRFEQSADQYDVYLASLNSGQQLRLHMQDHAVGADLDLYIANDKGELIDYSIGIEEYEELTVSEAGNYYLIVEAYYGASAYQLNLVNPTPQAMSLVRAPMTAKDNFIVGEVVGKISARNAGAALSNLQFSGALNAGARADRPLKIQTQKAISSLGMVLDGRSSIDRLTKKLPKLRISADHRERLNTIYNLKMLRSSGQFEYLELNRFRQHTSVNDPQFGALWHYEQIGIPNAWSRATGDGVIVAVLDTGILPEHEDLVGQTVPGYDLISYPEISVDRDGIDPDPTDPGDDPYGPNDSWHGSHVAGTIAAVANNGVGIAGAAYGAKIMPIRVLGYGGGTDYDIVQGIYFAAGLANDSGTIPQRRADIINMSLGGYGYSQLEQDAIQAARAAGVIVVAAAGNATDIADYYSPAGLAGVVTVAAVGRDTRPAYYTNYGPSVELLAPGGVSFGLNSDGGVLSTVGLDTSEGGLDYIYTRLQGTSMAAPHVSAVIALMKQVAPDMTPEQFDSLVATFGVTSGNGSHDPNYGFGLIDAELAVNSASALAGAPPLGSLFVEGGRFLNMGARLAADITVGSSSSGLSVSEIQSLETWLTATYLDTEVDGTGRYQVNVDATQLEAGTKMGTLRFVASSGSTYDLLVSTQIVPQDFQSGAHVGSIYLVFTDSQTGEVAGSIMAGYDTEQNYYFYRSPELQADRLYEVTAGTDVDNDFVICDVDELCGAYGTESEAVLVGAGDFDTDIGGVDLNLRVVTPIAPTPAAAVTNDGVSRLVSKSK